MGYYTRFNLTIDEPEGTNLWNQIHEDLTEQTQYGYIGSFDYYQDSWRDSDSWKWYEHRQDMTEFSKKYPTVLFTLEGWGEEGGDIWIEYFYNGKSEHHNARIVFPQQTVKRVNT